MKIAREGEEKVDDFPTRIVKANKVSWMVEGEEWRQQKWITIFANKQREKLYKTVEFTKRDAGPIKMSRIIYFFRLHTLFLDAHLSTFFIIFSS